MRRLPPLNALRAFEAAARHSSFTRAAEELRVTHGAVSRHIALLESWFGIPLFRRLTRQILLTDEARELFLEVSQSFDRIESAAAAMSHERRQSVVTVKAPPSLIMRWLMPRLSAFVAKYPRIDVRLTASLDAVNTASERHDIVVRRLPHAPPGFTSRLLLPATLMPICSPAVQRKLKLSQPDHLRQAILIKSATSPRAWSDFFEIAGIDLPKDARVLQFEQLYFCIQAAVDGLGVAIVPANLVMSDIEAGRLVFPVAGPPLPSEDYRMLVAKSGKKRMPVIRFIDWILDEGAATHRKLGNHIRSDGAANDGAAS